MKTILKILAILMIAALVAGGFYLIANNTSLASDMDHEGSRPSMTDASGQTIQPTEHPERGNEHGASLARGSAGVAGTLVKLAVITIIVLLIQKAFSLLGNRKAAQA